jgi:hypothetical protein
MPIGLRRDQSVYRVSNRQADRGRKRVVESGKRDWLRIALGRDLASGSVDVLGTQLEEVTE